MINQRIIIKDLSEVLFDQTNAIAEVLTKLEKVNLLLDDLMGNYGFAEKPELNYYFDNNISFDDTRKKQVCKWLIERKKILGFIEIVSDYVCESKKLLEEAIKVKDK